MPERGNLAPKLNSLKGSGLVDATVSGFSVNAGIPGRTIFTVFLDERLTGAIRRHRASRLNPAKPSTIHSPFPQTSPVVLTRFGAAPRIWEAPRSFLRFEICIEFTSILQDPDARLEPTPEYSRFATGADAGLTQPTLGTNGLCCIQSPMHRVSYTNSRSP